MHRTRDNYDKATRAGGMVDGVIADAKRGEYKKWMRNTKEITRRRRENSRRRREKG